MKPFDITLYGIIDPAHCNGRPLGELARVSAENGVTLIQYRDKHNDVREMIQNVNAIRQALVGTGVSVIVNDRVDVALATMVEGVHLGQQDMKVQDARDVLGDQAIIGLSVKTLEQAKACPVEVIDYAFVGGVFPTRSKDNPTAIGIEGWKERALLIRAKQASFPVGAIAGIDENNVASLIEAGCDGIAVISALYMQQDVAGATRAMRLAVGETTT